MAPDERGYAQVFSRTKLPRAARLSDVAGMSRFLTAYARLAEAQPQALAWVERSQGARASGNVACTARPADPNRPPNAAEPRTPHAAAAPLRRALARLAAFLAGG
jgi:hypothetical protein